MGFTPPFLDVRKVSGGWNVYGPSSTSNDDLDIYANTTDATSRIVLYGNAGIYFYTKAGSAIHFIDGLTDALKFLYNTAGNVYEITSVVDGKDLALLTTGTGVLKFGTYTAGAATDSTGYITIKDAAGNTRKLMVQA